MNDTQTQILMERFKNTVYLDKEETDHLAMSLNVKKKNIENWFGNMRRRKEQEGMLKRSE